MALETLPFMRLPDVPNIEHQATRNYLLQLSRVLRRLAGDASEDDRVITYKDLKDLGLI